MRARGAVMPRTSGPTVIDKAILLQDERFTKSEICSEVIHDLMRSGLVEEIIQGQDRADVLMVVRAARHSSKDAIMATLNNTLSRLGA